MLEPRLARSTAESEGMSPLRRERKRRLATLEQVCEDLDERSADGSSGVTASMLSLWERGQRTTSIRYRKMLANYYGVPAGDLFAHQDRELTADAETPRLLAGHHDLHAAMTAIVHEAETYLVVVGSRSRDAAYLDTIATVLIQRPDLVHYRVLLGPPRHQVLKDHLLKLVDIRDPHDRSFGVKTLHIGIVEGPDTPERFLCASERGAVVPIPSLTSSEAFDSGVLFESAVAERLIDHARQLYAGSRKIETTQAVDELPPE